MVPYDSRSPFVTSGIRIGTSAITSRGMNENDCVEIVEWIDSVLTHLDNDSYIADIKSKINNKMENYPLYPEIT
jgi:glycine hydroxymethyltransferase